MQAEPLPGRPAEGRPGALAGTRDVRGHRRAADDQWADREVLRERDGHVAGVRALRLDQDLIGACDWQRRNVQVAAKEANRLRRQDAALRPVYGDVGGEEAGADAAISEGHLLPRGAVEDQERSLVGRDRDGDAGPADG